MNNKCRSGIFAQQYVYEKAVKILTSSGKFRVSLGLERIEKILDLLGNPQDRLSCIHVAGTNGKGSVCAILASILNEEHKKVGLYTSPHIFKYTERIKIGNDKISDKNFAKYVFDISNLAEQNNIDLTEFEILTAVMFKYFADENVEVAVIETGLGGRFDATNVIKKSLCSVITHIDYDHTDKLGTTLDKIAYEKAGIMKKDSPCIVLEGREVFYDVASDVGALLEVISPVQLSNNLSLKGTYQQENLSLALAVIEKIFPQIDQTTIEHGLKKVKHPCRFQYIKEKKLIVDGAHNPNGIMSLVESLDFYYPNTERRFIFGCLKNKDSEKMLKYITQNNDEIYFYHFKHTNSNSIEDLQKIYPAGKKLLNSQQIDFTDGKLTVICGSFYMIEELLDFLGLSTYFLE
ncbi:bifunctional folylpolyglutamate synthase/dihydrofolate synthase [bacterium]|nr:bifunctional folylpolyglutamate synthase/dihydrofolate synthase [bacterium]